MWGAVVLERWVGGLEVLMPSREGCGSGCYVGNGGSVVFGADGGVVRNGRFCNE